MMFDAINRFANTMADTVTKFKGVRESAEGKTEEIEQCIETFNKSVEKAKAHKLKAKDKSIQEIYDVSTKVLKNTLDGLKKELEEAKDGMKKDLYGAYIIIPSTFSTAVDSINGTPQKAVFEYQINPHLEGQDRDNMIYELTAFQDSIRNNVSYVFLDAILKEVHNVQDGSMTILGKRKSVRCFGRRIDTDSRVYRVKREQ